MKKLAQIIKEHLQGKETSESKVIFSKISSSLQDKGFKPPFKIINIAAITDDPLLSRYQIERLKPLVMQYVKSLAFEKKHGFKIDENYLSDMVSGMLAETNEMIDESDLDKLFKLTNGNVPYKFETQIKSMVDNFVSDPSNEYFVKPFVLSDPESTESFGLVENPDMNPDIDRHDFGQ